MQASTQGCSTAPLCARRTREQAEPKAASLKEARVTAFEEVSRSPSSVAPVTTPSLRFLGARGSGSSSTAIRSTRAVGSHLPGSQLPRDLPWMSWLLVQTPILTALSLAKHAENVTSSATSLSNFLLYFNKRRQAYRQNSFCRTSGNFSTKNTC